MKYIINKITEEWIKQNAPCQEALDWYKDYLGESPIVILRRLIEAKKYIWANWFIVRVMTYHDYVSYAVFAAENVIDIYEKKYPEDKRPREAIEAAKKCIKNPTEENKAAAKAAAAAAWAAGAAVWVAGTAAGIAAEAAVWVAGTAAGTAAEAAAWVAGTAAEAAGAVMQLKILEFGMKLLSEE